MEFIINQAVVSKKTKLAASIFCNIINVNYKKSGS